MVQTQKNNQTTASKWMQWLLFVQIIALTYAALTNVVNFGARNDWLKLVLSAGVMVGLFMLRRQHKLYTVAVALCGVDFLLTILCKLILGNSSIRQAIYEWFLLDTPTVLFEIESKLLNFGSACSMAAFLLELLAHRTLVKGISAPLCKSWLWLTVAVLAVHIFVQILTLVVTNMLSAGTLNVEQYQQVYPFLNLPGVCAKIVYAVLLLQTSRRLSKS